jgi:hypothetical protein
VRLSSAPRAFLYLAFTILPLGHFFGRCRKYRELGGKRECFSVGNNELNDLEGFVMSPGQDIPVANENAIIILVVSASKIKRRFARRICHQNNGLCPRHGFSFWARWFSPASTCFSNTFLEVLLPALRMTNVECRLDQLRGKITVLELKREGHQGALRAWNGRE